MPKSSTLITRSVSGSNSILNKSVAQGFPFFSSRFPGDSCWVYALTPQMFPVELPDQKHQPGFVRSGDLKDFTNQFGREAKKGGELWRFIDQSAKAKPRSSTCASLSIRGSGSRNPQARLARRSRRNMRNGARRKRSARRRDCQP